jgi:hypothetical protein
MAIPTINLQAGRDIPTVKQNFTCPYVNNYYGVMFVSDGSRYIYFIFGYGQVSIYRYDCFTDGFARIDAGTLNTTNTPSTGANNGDVTYDRTRNRLFIVPGNATAGFYYFDISTGAISPALPVLPTVATYGLIKHTDMQRNPSANENYLYYMGGADRLLYRYSITSGNPLCAGKATSGAAGSLTDTGRAWTVDAHKGSTLNITGGTGSGQSLPVASNTATALTVTGSFSPVPDSTSIYTLTHTGTATSGAATSITDTAKTWVVNAFAACRVIITGGTGAGQERNIVSNTATALTVDVAWGINPAASSTYSIVGCWESFNLSNNAWAGASNLLVGDAADSFIPAALSTGANQVWLADLSATQFAVTRGAGTRTVYLFDVATPAYQGYLNLFCGGTISTGTISCYDDNTGWFYFVEASTRNLQKTKLNLNRPEQTGTATAASTSTTLVDTAKNYQNNIYGELYYVTILTGTGAGQTRKIVENTLDTLTVYPAWGVTPNATSTYEIKFSVLEYGTASATGSTSTVLSDPAKNWITNQYAGTKVKIIAGTGAGQERFVTANSPTTLTVDSVWTTTDATSVYEIKGLKCQAEPSLQMGASVSYLGNTMEMMNLNGLPFLYYWRKGSTAGDWFRYLAYTP